MRRSLRYTFLLTNLSLIILAMGLAGVLLLTSLERYFLEATEESLAAQARITAQALIPGAMTTGPQIESQSPLANTLQQRQASNLALQTENLALPGEKSVGSDPDLNYLADASLQLGAQLETRIRVLDTDAVVLVDSNSRLSGESLETDPLVQQALQGTYASDTTQELRENLMAVAMPVMVEDTLVGVIYLTQPLRDVSAVLSDLRGRWIWSTAIALVLSGIAGLALSQAVARPLKRLTTAAGEIARGHFDHQVPVRSQDELGQLSRTFNDMTNRLRAARQTQTTFVANVSHELRTPLTSIKGTVETLRDGAVNDITVRDRFLETVETETDRLIRLVNDLLVLTRADAEALNLRREPLDLAELARVTVERLAPQAQAREIALQITPAREAPLAWADRDRVAQVLVNLLDNAIKYSHPGGTVTVEIGAEAETDAALVHVVDRGIGIPAADLQQIGQRFYRVEKSRTRNTARRPSASLQNPQQASLFPPQFRDVPQSQSGSGLGLSIARALVNAHGGRLWIESQENSGTTVSFTLPAA